MLTFRLTILTKYECLHVYSGIGRLFNEVPAATQYYRGRCASSRVSKSAGKQRHYVKAWESEINNDSVAADARRSPSFIHRTTIMGSY